MRESNQAAQSFSARRVALGVVAGLIALWSVASLVLRPGSGPVSLRGQCRFNLKQIAVAQRLYHEDYGCYPPAYIADKNGKPMHSWRVLLLPYLGAAEIYNQYNFNEPWNGPNNSLIAKKHSSFSVYRCPEAHGTDGRFANYVAVTGPESVFDGSKACRDEDVPDPRNTIMLVEVADSDILWTEPRDLPRSKINFRINADRHGISSNHRGCVNVLFCGGDTVQLDGTHELESGHVEILDDSTSPERLGAMLTIRRRNP